MNIIMNLIVAADKNFGIGRDGAMPWHIPADMKYFKEKTLGKTVVMGRKTLESLPGGDPLKGRENIVITGSDSFQCEGAIIVHNIDKALEAVSALSPDDVFVIGGASVYNALLPYCKRAYVTRIDAVYEADTAMVNLDGAPGWRLEHCGDMQFSDEGVGFCFAVYVNDAVK